MEIDNFLKEFDDLKKGVSSKKINWGIERTNSELEVYSSEVILMVN